MNPATGFVPATDPLPRLPAYYEPWEQIVSRMGDLLRSGRLRAFVDRLPHLALTQIEDAQAQQRAMLLLSVLGNGYVWGGDAPAAVLPAQIAVPWCTLADQLGRLPVAAHESMVLNNWRRVDPQGSLALDNLAAQATFLGSRDEHWFYLVTLQIELDGAAALPALIRARAAAEADQPPAVVAQLQIVRAAVVRMLATLTRMQEQCDPAVFYQHIRPFFSSWPAPGVVYEGVSSAPRMLIGGSAAQSALVQAFDVGLDVVHESERTGPFLSEMRQYMPRTQRAFLEALAARGPLRPFVLAQAQRWPQLAEAYDACLAGLAAFRRKHIEISVRYIVHQAPDGEQAIGHGRHELRAVSERSAQGDHAPDHWRHPSGIAAGCVSVV